MEAETMPVPAKRGRPAKNAAVYSESGTMLLTSDEHERLNGLNRELDRLLSSIKQYLSTAAQRMFGIGEILSLIADRDVRLKLKACAELAGVDYHRASMAVRIYQKFADAPEQLEGMTMSELLPLIRVKRLPDGTDGGAEARQIQYASFPAGGEEAARESFGIAPLSGASLLRYRIRAEPQDGKYYLLEKGCGAAIPIASLSVDTPRNAEQQAAFREMQDEIQCAMERYYAVIERDGEDD